MLPESSMRTIEFGLWHQRVRLALGYPDILCFPMYCLEWRVFFLLGSSLFKLFPSPRNSNGLLYAEPRGSITTNATSRLPNRALTGYA